MTHTLGPWRVASYGEEDGRPTYMRENSGDFCISAGERNEESSKPVARATFQGKAKRGHTWNAPDPEGLANAQLISAAPDLLSALKNARSSLSAFGGDPTSVPEDKVEEMCVDKIQWVLMTEIDAAIAKAEGQRKQS